MAIEMLNLSINRSIKSDTQDILNDTSELKDDTAQILQEIAKLQAKLPEHGQTGDQYVMHRYLDSLTTYAESSFGQLSIQGLEEESRKPTPIEERLASDGIISLYPSSSSATAQGSYPSASASVSAPPLEAQASDLPLSRLPSSPHSFFPPEDPDLDPPFAVSDLSWCKNSALPFSFPHPQHATEGHTDLVYTICQTSNFVISGSRDRSIRVWNAKKRRLEYPPLLGHESSVFCVTADETQDLIVSCGGDRSIMTWQLSTGALKSRIPQAHGDSVLNIKLNEWYLVSSSKDCTAKVWDRKLLVLPNNRRVSEPFPQSVLRGHAAPINAVVLTDAEAVTACGDRQIRVFDLDSGTCLRRMSSHEKTITTLVLSADGRYIISAGGDSDIVIHSKESGNEVTRLQGHGDLIRALITIPEANLIVSGSYDETVAIWAFNEDGVWKKERSLDVKETQRRSLALDLRKRSSDFTEEIRKAVETGADADVEARSSGKVFCLLSRGKQILCGAGSTIVGWDFGDDPEVEEDFDTRVQSAAEAPKKQKGKRRQFFTSLKRGF
ncbi:WD40 repeat-like protein [Mytilinidion resinicola]|uniref:WD40 repeat-like protein n=1 Tax=Mytilinidion resinicola TaxID=574789 RepID=A0A6A6YSL6_9PEZI|nr:WD40 repeat-like protein [Mytilinidion resinicola]KAF2810907.1 WD40 repeat-like protein [Mytilinidion resinicola]